MSFFRSWPYELVLGWRYTRAGRATRRNGFISFISGVSMLGIALGVAALIIVLSVMNGFQREVRDRMLGVVSHIEIYAAGGGALPDVEGLRARLLAQPEVRGAAPFITAQALLARGEDMKGVLVRGIDPAREPEVSALQDGQAGVLQRLVPGQFQLVAGRDLAMAIGAVPGDQVTLISPSGQVTPAGGLRLQQRELHGSAGSVRLTLSEEALLTAFARAPSGRLENWQLLELLGMDSADAFNQAFLEVAERKLPQMAAVADAVVTPFQQLQTSMTNFFNEFGDNFAYLLNEMAKGVSDLADDAASLAGGRNFPVEGSLLGTAPAGAPDDSAFAVAVDP